MQKGSGQSTDMENRDDILKNCAPSAKCTNGLKYEVAEFLQALEVFFS